MARQIALLRGINLGSNRRLSMADLRDVMHGLGYEDAKTLLQSGNVVFSTPQAPRTVAGRIENRLARETGLEVDVLVRTRNELAKIVARNPLAEHVTDPKRYLVVFLSAKPRAKVLGEIDAAQFEPERFAVGRPRDLHLAARGRAEGQAHPCLLGEAPRRHRDRAQLEHRREAAHAGGRVSQGAASSSGCRPESKSRTNRPRPWSNWSPLP